MGRRVRRLCRASTTWDRVVRKWVEGDTLSLLKAEVTGAVEGPEVGGAEEAGWRVM